MRYSRFTVNLGQWCSRNPSNLCEEAATKVWTGLGKWEVFTCMLVSAYTKKIVK